MKLIVAGSRHLTQFNDQDLVKWLMRFNLKPTEIVSGGAKGIDELGEKSAEIYEVPVKRFNASWETYGKSAGPRRNREMAKYADALLAVWDGKSKGTQNIINEMKKLNKLVYVVMVP